MQKSALRNALLVLVTLAGLSEHSSAAEEPVAILAARISGHIHPSICRTRNGTLVVVYKGTDVLMCARSSDDGATWSRP